VSFSHSSMPRCSIETEPPMPQPEHRLAIIGYGKMGRLIEQLAPEYGFNVALKLDEYNNTGYQGVTPGNFRGINVAVDFSIPGAVVDNVERISKLGVNIVVGTTGWAEHLARVKSAVENNGIGLVWSPNYSIGVNVFARLVTEAARLLAAQPEYGAWAWEIHHSTKKDAPSGTLIKLVEEMNRTGYTRGIDVSSNRAGAHPGTHEIGFDSAADTITLRHVARSREGFARGALEAARWVVGKKGFHEFREILFH
jgi:4-hydroxy-tetrahydrodipicolinate reductase